MSWNASAHVLRLAEKYPDLTLTEMAVLYALAARHNHEYHCAFGTLKRISADAHVHPVTVSSTVTVLEERGLLRVFEGQIPRKKSDPEDRRFTRGTLWCFVGLDPDDGPDIEDVVPRVRTSGRPSKSISPGLNQLDDSISRERSDQLAGTADELAGSDGSISPGLTDELAGLNSPFKAGFKAGLKPDTTRSVVEPVIEPARAHAPEAPPRRGAEDQEPAGAAPPPKWEEIWPGQRLGRPGGQGEVALLKARCPLCERTLPIDEIEGHECVPVQGELVHRTASPGNLGGYFRRRRQREPIPDEARAELALMAAAPPPEIPPDIRAEHERRLAAQRSEEVRPQ